MEVRVSALLSFGDQNCTAGVLERAVRLCKWTGVHENGMASVDDGGDEKSGQDEATMLIHRKGCS